MPEPSLWSFVSNAGTVVKFVMLLLLATSVISWTIIIQRALFIKQAKAALKKFEQRFWSGQDLNQFYTQLKGRPNTLTGLEHIFYTGFSEFHRLKKQQIKTEEVLIGTRRVMKIALAKESLALNQQLSFLATVGSISPYIGLFGTVWGIMTSFRSLSGAQQATMAMVAPGISEALIATAMGLFVAIPAVIAYNRYANEMEILAATYDTFADEFYNILHRQTIVAMNLDNYAKD